MIPWATAAAGVLQSSLIHSTRKADDAVAVQLGRRRQGLGHAPRPQPARQQGLQVGQAVLVPEVHERVLPLILQRIPEEGALFLHQIQPLCHGPVPLGGGGKDLLHLLRLADAGPLHQILLVLKMPVEGGAGGAAVFGDGVDGDLLIVVFLQQFLQGGRQNAFRIRFQSHAAPHRPSIFVHIVAKASTKAKIYSTSGKTIFRFCLSERHLAPFETLRPRAGTVL